MCKPYLQSTLVAQLGLRVVLGGKQRRGQVNHGVGVLHHGGGKAVALARVVQALNLGGGAGEGDGGRLQMGVFGGLRGLGGLVVLMMGLRVLGAPWMGM